MIKQKAYRDKNYLKWVRTLPCCVCGNSSNDAHHIIGRGHLSGMGMTAPDTYVMPMCREHHTELHNTPEMWDNQWEWIARTLSKAISQGFYD